MMLDSVASAEGTIAQSRASDSESHFILFIDEVAVLLRVSRSTIERRRRDGTFPIPELPTFDNRPRWSRQAVERFLASSGGVPRRRAFARPRR